MRKLYAAILALSLVLAPAHMVYAKEQLQNIEEVEKIYRVMYTDEAEPITYTNKDGEPQGIAISLMNEIARVMGITVEYIEQSNVTEPVDINLSLYSGDALSYATRISEPYFHLPVLIIGDITNHSKGDVSIGAVNYYALDYEQLQSMYQGTELVLYDTLDEVKELFLEGELEYILVSNVIANEVVGWKEEPDITIMPTNQKLPGTLAYSNTLPDEFVQEMDKAIANLDPNLVDEFILLGVEESKIGYNLLDLWQDYRTEMYIIILMIALTFVLIALYTAFENKRKLLEYLNYDMVTGLKTEKYFIECLGTVMKNNGANYAVITIDIDNYKYINTTYGYDMGTMILVEFSKYIRGIQEIEHTARVFADQFLLLLDEEHLATVLQMLENDQAITRIFTKHLGAGYNLSLSMGVYSITGDEAVPTEVIDSANAARSVSKKTYGRISTEYTYEMTRELSNRNRIVQNMQKGIDNKDFYLLYQPKVDLNSDDKIIGAEALVRWECDGRYIYPDQCIGIFEDNGFIRTLDYYVFERVCELIKFHPQVPQIAVNLSGITLLEEDMVQKLTSILKKHDVDANRIQVEVTESAIIMENQKAIKQISSLKEVGFCIALDDFGAGESSLNRLKDFHIDVLKLDKEFLGSTLLNVKGVHIIECVINLAKKLNINVIAEGVETKEQAEVLRELGCDLGQGYYYAKPLPEEVFLERV